MSPARPLGDLRAACDAKVAQPSGQTRRRVTQGATLVTVADPVIYVSSSTTAYAVGVVGMHGNLNCYFSAVPEVLSL